MLTQYRWSGLGSAALEHAMWALALGLLLLASTFFYYELPFPAFFAMFLVVVLLIPAETIWNCVVASSCQHSQTLTPLHFVALFGLTVFWLIVPMALAAAFDERMQRCAGQDRHRSGIERISLVFFMGTGLSMTISIVGGAHSRFWAHDTTLGASLFINAYFVLPVALLPIGATCLRRGLFALYRHLALSSRS